LNLDAHALNRRKVMRERERELLINGGFDLVLANRPSGAPSKL
jgi:hypothetical protein